MLEPTVTEISRTPTTSGITATARAMAVVLPSATMVANRAVTIKRVVMVAKAATDSNSDISQTLTVPLPAVTAAATTRRLTLAMPVRKTDRYHENDGSAKVAG